jgi:hypothetical protein
MNTYTDIKVRTANPKLLDETVKALPMCKAAVLNDYDGTTCTLRVFGGEGFVRFALVNQGYAEIVEEKGDQLNGSV